MAVNAGAVRQRSAERLALDGQALTTRTGLRLAEQLPVESWQHVGRQISLIHNSSAWWLGDWLIYGQDAYPGRYRTALADSFLDYQTLRNYAWVARRFAPGRRRPGLSFQHHAEVAALDDVQQDQWLELAQANGWSKARLRRELRSRPRPVPAVSPVQLKIEIAEDRQRRWEKAAAQASADLRDWVIAVLDAAATAAIGSMDAGIDQEGASLLPARVRVRGLGVSRTSLQAPPAGIRGPPRGRTDDHPDRADRQPDYSWSARVPERCPEVRCPGSGRWRLGRHCGIAGQRVAHQFAAAQRLRPSWRADHHHAHPDPRRRPRRGR